MKPTPEQVLEALKKHRPDVGGYGSKWKAEATDDGVLLSCVCEWLPRHTTPTRVVLDLGEEGVTQVDEGESKDEAEFWTFQELVDWVEGYDG